MNKTIAVFLALVLGALFIGNNISAAAEAAIPTVSIEVSSSADEASGIISCTAEIDFPGDGLPGDGLKLSYHVKDPDGNIIGFENPRYPIKPEDGRDNIEFEINYADMLCQLGVENAYIDFDIVDEYNGFWYSLSGQYQIEADELPVEGLSGSPDASLVLTETAPDGGGLLCTADISFNDPELINDSLFLSYHITDIYGNEVQFENQRVPLSVDNAGAKAAIKVNAAEILAANGIQSGVVTFDIVDTENIFWYLDSSYYFVTQRITVDPSDYAPEQIIGTTNEAPTEPEKTAPVTAITSDYPESTFLYDLNPHVVVYFGDSSLYNENVKLSYRIYDENMNIISEENERFALNYSEGKAEADIRIKLTERGVKKGQNVIVRFDLVDEQNIFWFSRNELIDLNTQDISIVYDWQSDLKYTYLNVLLNQPVQLALNLIGSAAAIIALIKIKKILKG